MRRPEIVALARQFPWFRPRRVIRDAAAWMERRQKRSAWYGRVRGPFAKPVHAEETHVFPPPEGLPEFGAAEFRRVAARRSPAAGVFHLHDATLFSDEGAVFSRDNELLEEFTHRWGGGAPGAWIGRPFRAFDARPVIVEETVALLASPECRNFYHWLFDVLPRVHLLAEFAPVIERWAVPAGLAAWQVETLGWLGVPAGRLLELRPGRRVLCRRCFVPSLPGSEGSSPRWALEFLRGALLPHREEGGEKAPWLYVRRGVGVGRPVLNAEELEAHLASRGFTAIEAGALPLARQMALFQDAECVVAAHGAALSSLVFSERARVLELFSRDYLRPDCYFTLARQRGLPYRCWIDPRPPGTPQPWGSVLADLPAVDRLLASLGLAG